MNKHKIRASMLDTKVLYRCLLLCSLSIAIYMAGGSAVYAAGFNFCTPVDSILVTLLPGMATIGVIIIGIGAMLGRIQWQTAILCALGIAIAFGSGAIITLLGGTGCIA